MSQAEASGEDKICILSRIETPRKTCLTNNNDWLVDIVLPVMAALIGSSEDGTV